MALRLGKWALLVALVFGGVFGLALATGETPLLDQGVGRFLIAGVIGLCVLGLMRVLRLGKWAVKEGRDA